MTVRPRMSERLIARLRSEGWSIPDGATFRRLNPGHWQRSAGAWVWTITGHACDIGSCDTVRDCLKATRLVPFAYGEIIAEFDRPNAGALPRNEVE